MSGSAVLGRRERKKAEVTERILAVAEKLFRDKGYVETSMDEIAALADISRKTLFNYVTSKEAIIALLIDRFVRENMPDWEEQASADPIKFDPSDIISPHAKARIAAVAKNRWLLTLAAIHTGYYDTGKSEFVDNAISRNTRVRKERIAKVQQAGGIRNDITAEEICDYYDAVKDIVFKRWLLDPDSTDEDLYLRYSKAMTVLFKGVAADSR